MRRCARTWDKDECEAADGLQLTHPALATVLALDDAGGPTLVLPWRAAPAGGGFELAADDDVATAAFPKANTLLCFQGDLLHGVLPCATGSGERATLLMNGGAKPRAPCCVVPRDEAGTVEGAAESGAAPPPAPVAPSAADGEHHHELRRVPELVGGGAAELRLPWERGGRRRRERQKDGHCSRPRTYT